MSAQDQTIQQYHQLMQINAASHFIRAARLLGILGELREGQRTLEQLSQQLSLAPGSAERLLEALVAIGIVEKYGDDFALSRAAHLLCQYDDDLGDARWERLVDQIRKQDAASTDPVGEQAGEHGRSHFDYLAATQWVHTRAAVEAAEILDIGGEQTIAGPKILDLGCGSAVWSCAMAHQDPAATVTAVDNAAALEAASSTAASIGMSDRFTPVASDPMAADIPEAEYDLVLVAQRVSCLDTADAKGLLEQAVRSVRPQGRVAIIDLFRGPTRPSLSESTEALKLDLDTPGHIRTLDEIQGLLRQRGLQRVQFAFLPASKVNMGMAVGEKP